MKPARSRIPGCKTIEEEAKFWGDHSTTEYEREFEKEAHEMGVGPSMLIRMWVGLFAIGDRVVYSSDGRGRR